MMGRAWARSLVKSHREQLFSRTAEALADKRHSSSVFEEVLDWADQVQKLPTGYRLPPSATLNCDECRLVGGRGRLDVQRVQAANRKLLNAANTQEATVASILTFVAADGALFLSVNVFRARFGETNITTTCFTLSRVQQRASDTWLRLYGWTDTDFSDTAMFAAVMAASCAEWRLRNLSKACMLVDDVLGARRQVEGVRPAAKTNVLCRRPVAYTSDWLQVLDDKCFAHLRTIVPVLPDDKVI